MTTTTDWIDEVVDWQLSMAPPTLQNYGSPLIEDDSYWEYGTTAASWPVPQKRHDLDRRI